MIEEDKKANAFAYARERTVSRGSTNVFIARADVVLDLIVTCVGTPGFRTAYPIPIDPPLEIKKGDRYIFDWSGLPNIGRGVVRILNSERKVIRECQAEPPLD